jgi:hypothetical protein
MRVEYFFGMKRALMASPGRQLQKSVISGNGDGHRRIYSCFLPHTKKSVYLKRYRATLLQLYDNRIRHLFEKYNGRERKDGDFLNQKALKCIGPKRDLWAEALAPMFGAAHRLSPCFNYVGVGNFLIILKKTA